MQELPKKERELSRFPPKLRRLAEYLIYNMECESIKEACDMLNLNYDSIETMMSRYRRKYGMDLIDYVNDEWKKGLHRTKIFRRNSLVKRAMDGVMKAQELSWKLDGSLVERQEIKHDIGLSFVFCTDTIPEDILQKRVKEKANTPVIDVEPIKK